MVKLQLVALFAATFVLASCNGDDDNGSDDDDDTNDTDVGDDDTDDTDVGDDDDDNPSMTVEVTPDNGVPAYTVSFATIFGGWNDNPAWGFAGTATDLTNLGFGFSGEPGVDTYAIGAATDPNYAGFSDSTTFGNYGAFISLVGTVDVTRWDPTTPVFGAEATVMDGTIDVHLSNELPDPNHIEIHLSGEFSNLLMLDGTTPP